MQDTLIFIIVGILGLISIIIPIYSMITSKKIISGFDSLYITFIIENLCLGFVLIVYTTFKDTSALIDVGNFIQRISFIYWIILLILSVLYYKKVGINLSNIKYSAICSLTLILSQYLIAYHMIINASGFNESQSVPNPVFLIILINIVNLISIVIYKNKK